MCRFLDGHADSDDRVATQQPKRLTRPIPTCGGIRIEKLGTRRVSDGANELLIAVETSLSVTFTGFDLMTTEGQSGGADGLFSLSACVPMSILHLER